MTAPNNNKRNNEELRVIDTQPDFENAVRRALEMDEPLQGVLCSGLTVAGMVLSRLEMLRVSLERCRFEACDFFRRQLLRCLPDWLRFFRLHLSG